MMMVGTRSLILTCLLFLVPLMAKAVEPDEIMPDQSSRQEPARFPRNCAAWLPE